jgi:predicted phosphoribosyltransferase
MIFQDRREAGRHLARELAAYAENPGVVILALPRGGVPVAYEVARALNAPLDVFVVRKIGVPGQEELALGAIATGDTRVLNWELVRALGIGDRQIEDLTAMELKELDRRERAYRGNRPPLVARGRTVILIDDGLATGSTMLAAVRAVRQQGPERVIVAVPIASKQTCAALESEVDEVICAMTPEPFHAVGLWYRDFAQTSDEEVRELLEEVQSRSMSGVS